MGMTTSGSFTVVWLSATFWTNGHRLRKLIELLFSMSLGSINLGLLWLYIGSPSVFSLEQKLYFCFCLVLLCEGLRSFALAFLFLCCNLQNHIFRCLSSKRRNASEHFYQKIFSSRDTLLQLNNSNNSSSILNVCSPTYYFESSVAKVTAVLSYAKRHRCLLLLFLVSWSNDIR